MLTKTTAVMTRIDSAEQDVERTVTFVLPDDDTGETRRTVLIDFPGWVDLGSPEEVTVTVEPGDRLNADE